MRAKIFLIPFLLACCSCYSQEAKSDTVVELKRIVIDKSGEPPVANFDLSLLNIFVLKSGALYYYYDSSFTLKNGTDEFKMENLKDSFLHKTTKQKLFEVVKVYLRTSGGGDIVVAVQDHDRKREMVLYKEVLAPAKVKDTVVGYIPGELLDILEKIK